MLLVLFVLGNIVFVFAAAVVAGLVLLVLFVANARGFCAGFVSIVTPFKKNTIWLASLSSSGGRFVSAGDKGAA